MFTPTLLLTGKRLVIGAVILAPLIFASHTQAQSLKPPASQSATALSSSSIRVSWTAGKGGTKPAGYAIQRSLSGGGPFTTIVTVGSSATSYDDTGLNSATTYFYKVGAFSGTTTNYASDDPASATTLEAPPAAPSNLIATAASTNQINLSWTDNSNNETTFKIERATAAAGPFTQIGTTGAGVTTYSNTGLTASTTYYYRVRAGNSVGDSSYTTVASATTQALPDTTAPSVPTGLSASAVSSSQINLSWNASSDTGGSGLAGYRVYRNGTLIGTTSSTSYNSTGLSAATQYCYTVAAYDNAGNASAQSGQSCATTAAGADTTPPTVSLTAPANGQTVSNTIAVTASASDNVGVTRVEFYRDSGILLGQNTSAPYSLTYDTKQLTNGSYVLYAKAYDAAGNQSTSAGQTIYVNNPVSGASTPALVGFLPSLGVTRGVTVGGNRVYAACDVYGLTVVDVATPSTPRVLGASNLPFDGTWIAGTGATVVVTGVRTFYSTPGVETTKNGFYLLNATNGKSPQMVGMIETNSSLVFKRAAVAGNYAYVACGGAGLRVINLSNPSAPTIVGAYDTPGFAQGVAVAGSYAYVADDSAGLRILNISNPANPTSVGTLDTAGLASDVAVVGNYAYVADANALRVIDVSSPTAPVLRGSYAISAAYEVKVVGTTAYVGANGSGLIMINCSNPSAPSYLGAALPVGAPDASTVGVAVQSGYAYVANRTGGLAILNVSNPSSSTPVGQVMDWFSGYKIAHKPGQALVTGASYWNGGYSSVGGFQLINVTNPALPSVLSTYTNSTLVFKGVAISGNYAYIACGGAGLRVFNISNPVAPTIAGSYDTPGFAQAVAISGSYAYIADDSAGLQILNISNPATPTFVGTVDTPGLASDVFLAGNYAYVADANALRIIDVSNPAAPVIRGAYSLSAAYEVKVQGTTAYVSANGAGLVMINVSSPTSPSLLGSILPVGATGASTVGVALNNTTAYIANRTGGLAIYNVSNPAAPQLTSTVTTIGDARAAVYSNAWVYVADSLSSINTVSHTP